MNNLLKAFLCLLTIIPLIVQATVIHVPADQATIQAGINSAVNGDTVLVADSTYFENINFIGKAITVASRFLIDGDTSHISKTIIDGSQPSDPNKASVVIFTSGEDTTSILCGFTITGGTGTNYTAGGYDYRAGGGIYGNGGGARIGHNKIIHNNIYSQSRSVLGGGIFFKYVSAIIDSNIISYNSAESVSGNSWGGAIHLIAKGRIKGNIITNNVLTSFAALGGGISCYNQDPYNDVVICNNTVSYNQVHSTSSAIGGGLSIYYPDAKVSNNIITHNQLMGSPNMGGGISLFYTEGSIVKANRFENNTGGGLFNFYSNNTKIIQNKIFDNSAEIGAGIGVELSLNTEISDNQIISNLATDGQGGGFLINDSRGTKIVKNLIKGNTAASSSGGGLAILKSEPTADCSAWLINNTICENEALKGGGLFSEFAYLTIENTIFGGDSAETFNEIYYAGDSIYVNYCDVQDTWWPGQGNISSDPLFIEGDSLFHLSDGSPCINAGNPGTIYNDEDESRNDMGAYGGKTDSLVVITGLFKTTSEHNIPDKFVLSQNYPNPFNPVTTIEFQIPQTQFVTLTIYNILGQKIATLVSEKLLPGHYRYVWDASNFASGLYMYTLETEKGLLLTKRLLFLK